MPPGREPPRGRDRIARQPERAREHARAAARDEAERVSGRAPFSTSLKPPSPEKTKTASAVAPSRASSVAWPGAAR